MKVYVHFTREAKRDPVRMFNVELVRDLGEETVEVRSMFGGEPQVFTNVARVVAEPEPMEQEAGHDS